MTVIPVQLDTKTRCLAGRNLIISRLFRTATSNGIKDAGHDCSCHTVDNGSDDCDNGNDGGGNNGGGHNGGGDDGNAGGGNNGGGHNGGGNDGGGHNGGGNDGGGHNGGGND
ncbi:Hypothetical predicted protein, partial [Paramuricea clavata]